MGKTDIQRKYQFVTSCWQKSTNLNKVYLCFRWLLSLYFVGSFIAALFSYETWLYFIYLTHWSYILQVTQSILGTCLITTRFFQQTSYDRESIHLSWPERIYGTMFTVSVAQAPGITLLYWLLEDKPEIITPVSHLEHTFNSVAMFIDFFLHGTPLNAADFYWVLLFNLTYIFFSVFYFLAGGINMNGHRFIYRLLDWANLSQTLVICAMSLSMFLVLHVIFTLASEVKFWTVNRLIPKRRLSLPNKVTLV